MADLVFVAAFGVQKYTVAYPEPFCLVILLSWKIVLGQRKVKENENLKCFAYTDPPFD